MSVLMSILAASANAPAPQVWNCTAIHNNRAATKIVVLTNGAGEPIDVRGQPDMASGKRVLERLKLPKEIRLRIMTPSGDRLVQLSEFESAGRPRTVRVIRDLGQAYPYSETLLRGVCVSDPSAVQVSAPAEIEQKQRYSLWWVRLADAKKKPVDSTWQTTCTLATAQGDLLDLSMVVTWSFNKLKVTVKEPQASGWRYGPLELKGDARAALRREGFKGARGVFEMYSSAEAKTSPNHVEISLRLEENGEGIQQAAAVWTGGVKNSTLVGYGSCDPVPPGTLPRA